MVEHHPFIGAPFAMTNFLAQTRQNNINKIPYVYEDRPQRS